MKKFLSTAMAAAIAVSGTLAFTGDAEARQRHHHHNNNGDEIAAGILGFALGAVVAGAASNYYAPRRDYYYAAPRPYPRRYYAPRASYYADPAAAHIARCEARYRSYDRYSDTFIGRDGRRYYCNL